MIFRHKDEGEYQSPEDAYSFGQLLVYMFANWNFAWKLNFFPMPQVERYVDTLFLKFTRYFKVYKVHKVKIF